MSDYLKVTDLSISSKSKKLVKGISFQIDKGDTIALIGESGSGKSLTALALLGFLPKDLKTSGSVSYDDQNLLLLNDKSWYPIRKSAFSVILQNPMTSLNPTMTIGEQILEALPKEKASRKEVCLLLDEVGVPSYEAFCRYPHNYSGGQKQRIAIAIALASRPTFLVADEPTTALDVTVQKQIIKLLQKLQASYGFALLFITHDLPLAKALCKRTFVMYHGELLEQGDTASIFKAPKHPYTLSLMESFKSIASGKIEMHHGKRVFPYDRGCAFSLRCPYAMELCPEKKPSNLEKCWLYDKEAKEQKRKFDHVVSQV